MSTTQQTLIGIYHPVFREGYQDGRRHYFREPIIFTDKQFVEALQFVFEQTVQEEAKEREEGLYYSIGQLVGKMSGCVLPRQPHEDNTRELQEAFLTKVTQEYGAAGQALSNTIRQFWNIQDQLAQMLEADSFELMLSRGVEKERYL